MATSQAIRAASVRGSPVQIEVQRRRLFKAAGIVAVSRAPHATKLDIDEEMVIDALAVAGDIIDDVTY